MDFVAMNGLIEELESGRSMATESLPVECVILFIVCRERYFLQWAHNMKHLLLRLWAQAATISAMIGAFIC